VATTKLKKLWKHFRQQPAATLTMLRAFVRGCFYIVWFRLTSLGRVQIDFPFFCYTRVCITGRGRVHIGRDCSVFVNNFERLHIHTLTGEARVVIGERCSLGGVTIRCAEEIRLGDCILAAAVLLQDVPFSFPVVRSDRHTVLPAAPISIDDHVWLSGRSVVLPGSSLGEGSVLGICSVLFRQSVGAGYLVLGNPARRPLPIANLLQMRTHEK
jgi:acetyltransferase-like isoleucine patch superfamily enzyme